jgi:2-keto-4-pentenoate hydratase
MNAAHIAAAAAALGTGRGLADLPTGQRPHDRAEGYAIQAGWIAGPLIGWKIAATNVAGQRHIGVDGPLVGRFNAAMVHSDGATLSLAGNAMRVAEAEIGFVFGRDLPPRAAEYSRADVLDAVACLRLGIEVPDSRFADFVRAGGPQLIADNACAWQHVLGPEIADWRGHDLAAQPVLARVGGRYTRDGSGANVLGDPRTALHWMVNECRAQGIPLLAGQFVTTGTTTNPLEIVPGDTVIAEFPGLGRVTAHFTA